MSNEKKVVLVRSIWPKRAEEIIADHPWLVLVRERMSDTVRDMFSNAGIMIYDGCDSQERVNELCKEYDVTPPKIRTRKMTDIAECKDIHKDENNNCSKEVTRGPKSLNRPDKNKQAIDQIRDIFEQLNIDQNEIDIKYSMDKTIDRICKNPTIELIDALKVICVMGNAYNTLNRMIDKIDNELKDQEKCIDKMKETIINELYHIYNMDIKYKFPIYEVTILKDFKPYLRYRTMMRKHTTTDYVFNKFHIDIEKLKSDETEN